jgi:hypothetical protein
VLGLLAWHAANVVPVLDITHSLEWQRPARSANTVVGASVLALPLWVAIGILAVLKRLWDKWAPGDPLGDAGAPDAVRLRLAAGDGHAWTVPVACCDPPINVRHISAT